MSPTRIIYSSLLPQSRYDSKNFQVVLLSFQKYIFQSTFKTNLFFKYCHKDKHAPHRFSTWIFNNGKLPLIKHTVLFNKLAFSAVWIILTRIIYTPGISGGFFGHIIFQFFPRRHVGRAEVWRKAGKWLTLQALYELWLNESAVNLEPTSRSSQELLFNTKQGEIGEIYLVFPWLKRGDCHGVVKQSIFLRHLKKI